ncbi:putative F-box/kelch-repeat protein At5g28160 [Capsella rubella]|uniref:putative F-box/kelch-repeat protein At5g28160 n=1 Tax=Capsella rubella TaxID=81985 RepID=UPI000CD5798E|nr:putative F-box/kelch-repeat protein At5g28160 [Capsella rubella]
MVPKRDETYEEPLHKKKQDSNPSYSSLPDEIILNVFARVSRSNYPRLALVCKNFRSLILSSDLNVTRFHLKTQEILVHVYLQFPDSDRPSLFTLWIKPGHTLTNQLGKNEKPTGNIRLVQIPSYFSYTPMQSVAVGSEWYGISQGDTPSSTIWVLSKDIYGSFWRKASNMTVAREKPLACALDGKLYVIGGCTAKRSTNWGEVFDPRTQTWEPLPDPRPEQRFSSIRKLECWIDKVLYRCNKHRCSWYNRKCKQWRVVKGFTMMNWDGNIGMIEVANYGGKLLILWDKSTYDDKPGYKDIWCAVISLKRHVRPEIDEVEGNIEWADIVHKVPNSYVFVRSVLNEV